MSDAAMGGPGPLVEMSGEEFRAAGHAAIDWIAEYLEHPERWRILPETSPGEVVLALPAEAPAAGEPMARILATSSG